VWADTEAILAGIGALAIACSLGVTVILIWSERRRR
jgi:hypothetical protein